MLRLGPYALLDLAGKGGMGEVWRGQHLRSGAPVAIKVLRPESDAWEAERFAGEIRSMARLDHPGIVYVLDAGEVPTGVGPLRPGSAWLALEYCGGGSLSARCGRVRWPEARSLLLGLLDALGHAHARGVVHRDLKPGNVLLATAEDSRSGWKIADFGLARQPGDATTAVERIAGTLLYMAPEQIDRDLGPFGPWTDLYGLGCVAWALLTGRSPYSGLKAADLVAAHFAGRLPVLEPRSPVPPEARVWLARLLATSPSDRYPTAAAAAEALAAIQAPLGEDAPTGRLAQPVSRALPVSWRVRRAPPPLPLLDAAPGLSRLRRWPIVGREDERDALWAAVGRAAERRAPAVVCLEGPPGVGRSRLLAWLVERAAELGLPAVLVRGGDPVAPLPWLAARLLGAEKPTQAAWVAGAADRLVGRVDGPALAALAGGTVGPEAVVALLRAVAASTRDGAGEGSRPRPLVIGVDAVAADPSLLGLAQALATVDAPVVVACATDADGLPGAQAVSVAPLEVGALTRLAVELGLAPELAGRLHDLVGGLPRPLEGLLGAWLARGWLQPGPAGLDLIPEARPWGPSRATDPAVDAALAELPEADRPALEALAARAPVVREADWVAATEAWPGAALSRARVLDALLRARLIEERPGGLAVLHPALRGAVAAGADDWPAVCAAAARTEPVLGRRGRLLLEAGEAEAALDALLDAAQSTARAAGYPAGLAVLDDAERAAVSAGVPEEDPRRGRLLLLRARLTAGVDRGAAEARAEAAVAWARGRDPVLEAAAAVTLGLLCGRRGDLRSAEGHFRRAIACVEGRAGAPGIDETVGAAWQGASRVCAALGDRREAVVCAHRAIEAYTRAGNAFAATRAAIYAALDGSLWVEARAAVAEALAMAHARGDRVGQALVWDAAAEVARASGDLPGAVDALRRVIALRDALGDVSQPMPQIQLALVYLLQRAGAQARAELRALDGRPPTEPVVRETWHLVGAAVGAEGAEWEEVTRHLDGLVPLRRQLQGAQPEGLWCLRIVAHRARGGGRDDLAERADEFALDYRSRGRSR
jgi:tetratricopeptide (TPR) repeat protein